MKTFKFLAVISVLISAIFISGCSAENNEEADNNVEVVINVDAVANVDAVTNEGDVKRFDTACGSDIKEYCSQVQPGDGRISACIYAHTAQITDSCYAVTERVGIILESVFDGIERISAACSTDLQEYCSDKVPGTGEPLACLRENRAEISADCVAALPDNR